MQRMFAELGLASLTEVTLANGRRADVMAVGPKGEIVIVEVKSCLQDFRTDQKWPEYAPYCDRFYFAVDCDFPKDRIPEHAGLMVCDGFGGAVLRECEPALLNAARRKAVTLSFAIKESTAQAIRELHAQGLRVIMATGDNERTAQAVASKLGIDEVRAGVLPEAKKDLIDQLRREGHKIAMAETG